MDNDYKCLVDLYNESIGKSVATGAMAAASLLGSPNTTMGDTTYNQNYSSENQRVLNDIDKIVELWSKYYQTSEDKEKEARAKEVLENGVNIPKHAKNAIDVAVYIFGGDMGVDPNVLEDLLIYTGEIESGYKTRRQYKGGPARGYWQVEPATAADHFNRGSALMGDKFKKRFYKELKALHKGASIADIMETNDEFAAAMAAMTWIRQAHKELR